jgi:hypothetical protein
MPLRGRATGRNWRAGGGLLTPRPWAVCGRRANGAVCPCLRLGPGARGDIRGDRPGPDPVWKRPATPPLPPPRRCAVSPGLPAVTMARRTLPQPRAKTVLPPQRAAVNLHAAGIDVGAEAHEVAVPPRDDPQPVRCVGASTVDVERVAAWLAACAVTTIALESTGVDGLPLVELVERRGFEVRRVDPPQGQKIKGRPKRDVHACQGRQRLHPVGLLAGACRPPDQVGVLRSSLRPRAMFLA